MSGMRAPRALAALLLSATVATAGEWERAILDANGLSADAASLRSYLRPLRPTEDERRVAREAVARLASGTPAQRHRAVQWLGTLSGPPLTALREAAESPDPDVRRIVEQLREEVLGRVHRELLRAVLRTVAEAPVKGLAQEVLDLAILAAELHLEAELARALRATLTEDDLPKLRDVAAAGDLHTRTLAVRALGAAPGAGSEEAVAYAESPEERLRLAAALALADRGDRRGVGLLGLLLDADDERVRREAAGALRVVCGAGPLYDPFAARDARRDAAAAWREWIAAQGDAVTWDHPLPFGARLLGRTLIAFYNEGRVVELDAAGRTTFEVTGLQHPWAVQGLPDGRRFVILHQARVMVEYGADGAEVARRPLPEGWFGNFQRLDNGHMLAATMSPNRIVEFDEAGTVLFEVDTPAPAMDVQLLENGNFLVCLMRPAEVIELDREGHVRWSLKGFKQPLCARRLENGHTLVADTMGTGRAAEFDREGRAVWELNGLRYCYSLERLPDGSTLVADMSGVREVAPDGSVRWILEATSLVRACRY